MTISKEIAERLAFIGMDAESRGLLEKFVPTLEKELPGMIDLFYQQVKKSPDLAKMFDGTSSMNRAASAQTEHWLHLFSGNLNDEYVASVRRIGVRHSRIGLDPRWYVGGYSFVLKHVFALVGRHHAGILGGGSEKAARLTSAIAQAAMIDMELAISCYIDENKKHYADRLNQLAADFERRIGSLVDQFASASTELESTARSMADTTDRANQKAMTVAAAAEQASAGTQTVASAAEQLSASSHLIAQQVQQSSAKSELAASAAAQARTVVDSLAEGAEKIGHVINMIGQIANKTNMLALNASIEAARAGESGRAFEIVANEVKTLATQTARATEEVEMQISRIQGSTRNAVDSIGAITAVVNELAEIARTIAGAVGEQNAATHEISRNVQQTAAAAQEVATHIVGVSQASEQTGAAAGQIFSSAGELSQRANSLSVEVGTFLQDVKAA